MDFYYDEWLYRDLDENIREALEWDDYKRIFEVTGTIPLLPFELSKNYPKRCNFQRLDDMTASVLRKAHDKFPTKSSLLRLQRADSFSFRVNHTYDHFRWNTKIEYGRRKEEKGKPDEFYVNVRMSNDGFVYLQEKVKHLFSNPPVIVTRHRIKLTDWYEINTETHPSVLNPFVRYFTNWFFECRYDCGDEPPGFTCKGEAWYNEMYNRMDIELSTLITDSTTSPPTTKMCKWSLCFEPWSPVIKSTKKGAEALRKLRLRK